ncbi:aspartic proteinase CDR1-like, partial [Neltuma alba]|uniref:aspartic proteinase CDR1-like n=1 Tax=Neltuma alba TaxID=207710 RepID=UPI0010A325C2
MKAARRSVSRIKHFRDRTGGGGNGAVITPNRGDYLMKMFMGTPLVELHAAADTGSDLVWVPCLPCGGCDPQNAFDPAKSSTFMVLTCDSQPCASLPRHSCGNSNQCRYFYKYGDQSFSTGDLATDTINFGNAVSSPSTVIGCGHDNQFEDNTGIAGLGGGPLSLISQLGDQIRHKFSYCLLPFSSNTNSKLKFGDEATTSSSPNNDDAIVSTPLFTKTRQPFTMSISKCHRWAQDCSDSELRDAVREAVGVEPVTKPPDPLDLCFRYESEMRRSDSISILGNIAQINFQVAFDLAEQK